MKKGRILRGNIMKNKKHIVWILWGDSDRQLEQYSFQSKDQINFFLTGISEAYEQIGCAEYEYLIQDKKPKLTDFDLEEIRYE
tara:strand:- start:858 stop:1106 length:249 start_codon:yes stop_codon:yes gene_type:complete